MDLRQTLLIVINYTKTEFQNMNNNPAEKISHLFRDAVWKRVLWPTLSNNKGIYINHLNLYFILPVSWGYSKAEEFIFTRKQVWQSISFVIFDESNKDKISGESNNVARKIISNKFINAVLLPSKINTLIKLRLGFLATKIIYLSSNPNFI